MVFIYINKNLLSFEADIRDICMAFFSLKKLVFLYENDLGEYLDKDGNDVDKIKKDCINTNNDLSLDFIIVKDYYNKKVSSNRKETKLELKRYLYDYLKKLTHKKLLWGTLTGIRPVNIVTEIIENKYNNINIDYQYIKDILNKEYYLSNEKSNELIDIAKKELSILKRRELLNYKDKYSIYIGVPFCKSTCLYCSFTSFNIDKYKNYVNKYLSKLEQELKENVNKSPLTIYIGGGTPTSLDEYEFEIMLSLIDKNIDKTNTIEYTIEAGRPDTITKEKLLLMKKHGVTRISINPQTFNQKTLDIIGRKHTIKDVLDKYYLARELGFDNINMDLILGLPNENISEIKTTLKYIKNLKPDSVTIHSLALKRSARLNKEFDNFYKNYYFAGLDEKSNIILDKMFSNSNRVIDKMFRLSKKAIESLGLEPYYLYRQKNIAGNLENVGYSINGKECIYNIMMMSERHTVYGFGTSTTKIITYNGNEKIVKNILGYKSVIDYCC